MASVTASPRYGSAAELATYAGVSVKTVRRLVGSGKVQAFKLGRRTLIRFADFEAHILEADGERSGTVQSTLPQSSFDARGRAIPLDPDQARLRAAEVLRALDDLDAMGDEEEQRATFAALAAAVDADRLSDRPRFGG